MRILQVIEVFAPSKGGSIDSVYHVSKFLALKGHEVTVCTSDFHRSYEQVIEGQGFEVIAFKVALQVSNFYITPTMIPWVKKHLKEFDVVHLTDFPTFQNAVVSFFARRCGVPYILSAQGSLPNYWGRRVQKAAYNVVFGRYILKHAAALQALSQAEVAHYEARGVPKSKIKVIPNAVDLSQYQDLPEWGSFRRRFNIDAEEKLVLYLGRLHALKRVDLLINAFARLSAKVDRVRLVIAGPDEGSLSKLRELTQALGIEDKVLFTGHLFLQGKLEAYQDADIFVQPSADEIFGITVLESWACGTPVIATKQCHVLDGVDEKAALVVEDNEAKLADAIHRLLVNEEERKQMVNLGKRIVAERFGIERIVEQLEEVYHTVQSKTREE